ncbi:MerR family transcriptional regulator [Bacillus wiedmannii]|uniref:MerR family transcriptional regulator n=1 Tax=Bacillus wiedmannii TaxID=1890302 RepID=UPI001E29893B|nr:MerR family transcriptional regulator [Bacillus wiedmannii]MCC2425450.1 MerR family transcriptional regulator [Bacillus wiedmannii]
MEENKEYSLKEVTKVTGLSSDLLRIYEKEFNLQINRTQGGHRRYTEEDINQLVTIKKKIQDLNWSYKQVRNWLNGEDTSLALQDHEVVSNLEKQMNEQKEMIQDLSEKLDQSLTFQATMMQKMVELQTENNEMRKTMLQIGTTTEEKEDREEVKQTLGEINHRLKSFDERLEETKASRTQEPNKSFLQRLFGR